MNEPILIGKLNRTHGLKGHINLTISIDEEIMFDDLKFMFISLNNQKIPFFIEEIQDKANKLLVKFEKIDSEPEAKKLVNKDVFVLPEFIGAEEESELDQFVGYTIIDAVHGELGTITTVEEYPQHFVFILTYKEKELLLPASDELILRIDDNTKTIYYAAPEGLIDVYLQS